MSKFGSTLSEVLITIAVIGVVSAVTLTSVINKINNLQYKNAYKKAYSDLSNAMQNAVNDGLSADSNSNAYYEYIKSYFKVIKTCENSNAFDCWVDADKVCTGPCGGNRPSKQEKMFVDSSGRVWGQFFTQYSILLVDTNGHKLPNQFGKDRWIFSYSAINHIPAKIAPYKDDITKNDPWCNHPPCYYRSWLYK